jgi:glycosyltransferase involved in cell wall biosynthesis
MDLEPNIKQRPITVLQMVPELQEGGVECATLEMAAHLVKQGHISMVISEGGRMVPQLTAAGSVHLRYAHVGEKSPRCLSHIVPLRRLLMQRHVDVLHLRSRLPAWVGYLAWLSLPPPRRPKLVTTFHGFYSVNAYSAVMTRAERIIAVSDTIKAHIRQAYHIRADRITVIHEGVDETLFSPERVNPERIEAIRDAWRLEHADIPLIFFPGRITRLKGHALFIESLALIRELPWVAVCAGDLNENPSLAAELKAQIHKHGMQERILFCGYCADMPAALMLAQVVVSPSIKPESFGRTAIEAHAMGKPVVASAHGGSLETVLDRQTGWLVTPGDPGAMAAALSRAITDRPLAARMGRAGQEWVRQTFCAREKRDQTLRLYRDLLAAKPPSIG